MQLGVLGGGSGADALSGRSSVLSSPAPASTGALGPASSPSPAASGSGTAGSRPAETNASGPREQPAAGRSAAASGSGTPGSDSSGSNPSGEGRCAASGNSGGNSNVGGQTARSTTKGRGASGKSGAGAAQAVAQGAAAQAAAAATDFSAALARSLAATPTDGTAPAPAETPAAKAGANPDADGSIEPTAKHAAIDPVSSALALLEQALAGAMAGIASAPSASNASSASASDSAAGSGAVAADGKSSAAALSTLLAQTLSADPKPGAANPTPTGNAATPVAPAAAANTAAAALAAAAQLSSGSHIGAQQGTTDSSRMTLTSPVGTDAWTDELGTKLTWMAHQGIESASLQLSPEHLGPLQVTIALHDGQASVWFGAAQPDTRTALQQSLPQLRQLFAGQGLTLADAGVSRESPRDQGRQGAARPGASVSGVGAVNLESPGARASTTGGLGLLDTYV